MESFEFQVDLRINYFHFIFSLPFPVDSFARPLWESPVVDGHEDDLSGHFPIQPFIPRPGNHPDPQLAQPCLPHPCLNTPKIRICMITIYVPPPKKKELKSLKELLIWNTISSSPSRTHMQKHTHTCWTVNMHLYNTSSERTRARLHPLAPSLLQKRTNAPTVAAAGSNLAVKRHRQSAACINACPLEKPQDQIDASSTLCPSADTWVWSPQLPPLCFN